MKLSSENDPMKLSTKEVENNIKEIVLGLGSMRKVLALYKENDKVSKFAIRFAKTIYKPSGKVTRRKK